MLILITSTPSILLGLRRWQNNSQAIFWPKMCYDIPNQEVPREENVSGIVNFAHHIQVCLSLKSDKAKTVGHSKLKIGGQVRYRLTFHYTKHRWIAGRIVNFIYNPADSMLGGWYHLVVKKTKNKQIKTDLYRDITSK